MADLLRAREDLPALGGKVWFDNGTVSLTPRPIAEAVASDLQRIVLEGPLHLIEPEVEWPRRRQTMEHIAAFLGTDGSSLALMRGVSEAYQTVLRGITWNAGDEIIISDDEEIALLLPTLHLRATRGVAVRRLPYHSDPAEIVSSLESLMGPRTRLVALSHVTTDFGWVYPIASLTQSANARGIPLFADLAHSVGLIPTTLPALWCDFAGVLSYKWMFGPYASGALYVRRDAVVQPELAYAGNRSEVSIDPEAETFELHDDARRFQYGPWAWPLIHGWARALQYLTDFGTDAIWDRTQALVAQLHDGLSALPHVTVASPRPPNAGGLVTFSVNGISADAVKATLHRQHEIRIKAVPGRRNLLRASVPFFLTEAEIELLIGAVADLRPGSGG